MFVWKTHSKVINRFATTHYYLTTKNYLIVNSMIFHCRFSSTDGNKKLSQQTPQVFSL